MRTLRNLLVIMYTVILILSGGVLIALAFGLIPSMEVSKTIDAIYATRNLRISLGATGGILIAVSILLLQLFMGKLQREKNISFTNPDGRVSISLHAIEDYIKRIAVSIQEIKDIKSEVVAGKKAIEIFTKVTLWSDINIPETTEKIQSIIKLRLQEMLGIEESIYVEVNVIKIVHREEGRRK